MEHTAMKELLRLLKWVPIRTRITGTRDRFIIKVFRLSTLRLFLHYHCLYPQHRWKTWQNLYCPEEEEEDTHPLEEGGREGEGKRSKPAVWIRITFFKRNLSKAPSSDRKTLINEDLPGNLLKETSSRSTQRPRQSLGRETGFRVSH